MLPTRFITIGYAVFQIHVKMCGIGMYGVKKRKKDSMQQTVPQLKKPTDPCGGSWALQCPLWWQWAPAAWRSHHCLLGVGHAGLPPQPVSRGRYLADDVVDVLHCHLGWAVRVDEDVSLLNRTDRSEIQNCSIQKRFSLNSSPFFHYFYNTIWESLYIILLYKDAYILVIKEWL